MELPPPPPHIQLRDYVIKLHLKINKTKVQVVGTCTSLTIMILKICNFFFFFEEGGGLL